MRIASAAWLLLFAAVLACDRRVEPFDPDEKAEIPDLSRIFPPEQAERAPMPGAPALPPPPPGPARGTIAAGGAAIRGTVDVAPELAGRVPSGGVLFLIARGAGGGPPLAARRIESPRFPLAFELGPEDRMIADRPFEGPLQLTARLDSDGNATTREPGDLQGSLPDTVSPGESGLTVVLDQVL